MYRAVEAKDYLAAAKAAPSMRVMMECEAEVAELEQVFTYILDMILCILRTSNISMILYIGMLVYMRHVMYNRPCGLRRHVPPFSYV